MSADVIKMVQGMIKGYADERNEIMTEIGTLTGDRTKLVHDYRTDPDTEDEEIKAYQEWEEQAHAELEAQRAAMDAKITAKYLPEIDEEDVKAKQAKADELLKSYKAAIKFAETVPGFDKDKDLADIPALVNAKGGTAGSGTGSKRPRLQRVAYRLAASDPWTEVKEVKEVKGENVDVTNFSLLATTLRDAKVGKVEVKALQEAAFAEAKTDDLSTLGGTVFDFAVDVGDKTVFVQVQPKAATDK